MNILYDAIQITSGVFLLVIAYSILKFFIKRHTVRRVVRGSRSGMYIEHGMIINRGTGMAEPQQRPSRQAFLHFK